MSAAFDYMACATVESAYSGFVGLLETVLEFPLLMLKTLRNIIKMMKATAYGLLKDSYDYLEELLDKFLKFPDKNENANDFCDSLLKCEFLFKSVLPTSINGKYLDPSTGEYVNGYEWFKRNICGSGFADFYDNIKSFILDEISNVIERITSYADKGFDYINEQIQKAKDAYMDFLYAPISSYVPGFETLWSFLGVFNWVDPDVFDPATSNILDLIELLNLFGECIFSVCDLSVTVANKLVDIKSKLSLDQRTNNYKPSDDEIEMKTTEKKMAKKINSINV
jgi:hypothetical protein